MMTVHTYNENYFDIIDTPQKAYFLGLMYADGAIWHIDKIGKYGNILHEYYMSINLQEEDRPILELFRKELQWTHELWFISRSSKNENWLDQYKINLSGTKIHHDLEKHGCVEKKSLILQFPTTVPEEFMSHFIRGYFDGDGCIWCGKRKFMKFKSRPKGRIIQNVKFHFTGCIDFISKLENYLNEKIGLSIVKINRTHSRPEQSDRVCMLEYSGRKNIKKFYDYIYKDCEEFYIPRKKEKFEEIICALSEKSLSELGLIAGTPEMVISSQAKKLEGSSTIPEMEVESSDSKCPTLTE